MGKMMLNYRLEEEVERERDRVLRNVVSLVGRLSDEVVNCMMERPNGVADVKPHMVDVTPVAVDVEPVVVKSKPTAAKAKPVAVKAKPTNSSPANGRAIEEVVEEVIAQKFGDVLSDISYRIGVLQDVLRSAQGEPHKITSAHLNLSQHLLDGYIFNNNSPAAGSVSWQDCNIAFQGSTHSVSNSATALRYIHWLSATPSVFQVGGSKPTLTRNDCLVAINEAGIAHVNLDPGKIQSGAHLADSTIRESELGSAAVTSAKLAASAIFTSHVSPSAITTDRISPSAVTNTQIALNAITTDRITPSAITTDRISPSAVGTTQITPSAITTDRISPSAVSTTQISPSAVNEGRLADNAVTGGKISASAVTSAKLADGAIISGKIGAGQVPTSKLNLATHLLF